MFIEILEEMLKLDVDTSNQEFYCPSPKYKNKKLIGLTKDELGGKIMIKFIGRRAKTCIYLTDDGSEDKKTKVTKKCAMKSYLNLENYKSRLASTKLKNKINLEKKKIDIDNVKKTINNS